ncbi:MAG: reverse transcriptase domain-containing protein, partial [Cyanobacteria bacterium P01_A01_bin.17]
MNLDDGFPIRKLKDAKTRKDVAKLLGYNYRRLNYLLYKASDHEKYKEFEIPKRSGGVRKIESPQGGLKLLQRRLASLLQDCQEEIEREHSSKRRKTVSHGFKRRKNICTNAKRHRNRRYVFNIDLLDFFHSIHLGRVRGFFIKDKHFELEPQVATTIAQIACFKGRLPQGSACSPVISNLIGHILDVQMIRLASRNGCVYTRYADDLTFSTNKRCFPSAIALTEDESGHLWHPGPDLLRILLHSGFEVNV